MAAFPSRFPRRTPTLVMDDCEPERPRARTTSGSLLILRLVSGLAGIADTAARVREACSRPPFTRADAVEVERCVREALANVTLHSYGGAEGEPIDVIVLRSPAAIVVEIVDRGTPSSAERIERGPRGRGLTILHAAMSSVRYATTAGRNVLTLVRKSAR